jgi:hypothetical protein
MFAELRDRNPEVRIRYRGPNGATEETMSLLKYRRWLAESAARGQTLEWVEMTKKGETT